MTSHELAEKLLELPDIEVLIPDYEFDEYNSITKIEIENITYIERREVEKKDGVVLHHL